MTASRPPRMSFWSELADVDQTELVRNGHLRRFAAGALIYGQGDRADTVMVVRSGCVKEAAHSDDGYQAVLALYDPGDLVGGESVRDGNERAATTYALTDVYALVVPSARFMIFVRTRPRAGEELLRLLSTRLHESERFRLASRATPISVRMAGLLLDLSGRWGVREEPGVTRIALPLSREDLAGLVLTSKRTVGRVLAVWRKQGWIATDRRVIRLTNRSALERAIEDPSGY